MPKGQVGGKLVPLRRHDGTFVDGADNEEEALRVWQEIRANGDNNLVTILWRLHDVLVVLAEKLERLPSGE
jgi:hypothetical protein